MDELDQIEEELAAITPGCWEPYYIDGASACVWWAWSRDLDDGTMPPRGLWLHGPIKLDEDEFTITDSPPFPFSRHDAKFIANAPSHVRSLLDEVARLDAALRIARTEMMRAKYPERALDQIDAAVDTLYAQMEPSVPDTGALRGTGEGDA